MRSNWKHGLIGIALGVLLTVANAYAQMMLMTGAGLGAAATANPAISFVGCTGDATNATTYTFSSHSVGTASADRITIVAAGGRDDAADQTVSTITVGGDSATLIPAHPDDPTLLSSAAMGSLANPSGTSEDIVVTFSEAITSAYVCVWTATGIDVGAYNWDTGQNSAGALFNLNHVTYANGVSAGICFSPTSTDTHTWAGLTEQFDGNNGETAASAADFTNDATADTPLTVSCDPSGAGVSVGIAAHWRATAPADPSATFVACTADDTNATTYTYTSASIGTAADNRIVVVGVLAEDAATVFSVSSMTIGGTSASEVVDEDGTGIVNSALYYLLVPTGTTATIAVTHSEAITSSVICVWALYDVGMVTPMRSVSPSFGVADDDTASGALVLTHTTTTKGISIGVCTNSGVADAATWAGLTEQADTESAELDYSAAHLVEDAGTSVAATCDWTGGNDASGSAAHWR